MASNKAIRRAAKEAPREAHRIAGEPHRRLDTRWEEITPDVALAYLEKVHNRPLSIGYVRKLTRQMKENAWHDHHQGIAFDRFGRLVDGQHRLWAIVESTKTQWLLVTRGVSYTSEFDVPRTRKPHHTLGAFGAVSKRETDTLYRMLFPTRDRMPTIQQSELLKLWRAHQRSVQKAWAMFHPKKTATPHVAAAIASLLENGTAAETLERFCALISGEAVDDDSIGLRVRNAIDERLRGALQFQIARECALLYAKRGKQ